MARRYLTAEERHLIIERAQKRCEYCQSPMNYATQSFVFEHIVPVSRGGLTALDNMALACGGCNGHKYTKIESPDPVSGQIVPLFNPRQQKWQDHFGWNEDYSYLVGLTPTGRATAEALKMNRTGIVNIRQLLVTIGKHPPSIEN